METSHVRFTPLPSGLASRLPCSMCHRTVRGDIPRALAACCVVTHPEGATQEPRLRPRPLWMSREGYPGACRWSYRAFLPYAHHRQGPALVDHHRCPDDRSLVPG
jgi:hypothetical protein